MKNKPNNDIICLLIEIIGDVNLFNLFSGIKYSNYSTSVCDYDYPMFSITSNICYRDQSKRTCVGFVGSLFFLFRVYFDTNRTINHLHLSTNLLYIIELPFSFLR